VHARRHRSEAVCTLQTRHQAVKPARESCRHNYRTSDRKSLMPVSDCIPVFGRGISRCLQSPRLPPNPAARSCLHSLHQARLWPLQRRCCPARLFPRFLVGGVSCTMGGTPSKDRRLALMLESQIAEVHAAKVR
jgi:hypothetical protein